MSNKELEQVSHQDKDTRIKIEERSSRDIYEHYSTNPFCLVNNYPQKVTKPSHSFFLIIPKFIRQVKHYAEHKGIYCNKDSWHPLAPWSHHIAKLYCAIHAQMMQLREGS